MESIQLACKRERYHENSGSVRYILTWNYQILKTKSVTGIGCNSFCHHHRHHHHRHRW